MIWIWIVGGLAAGFYMAILGLNFRSKPPVPLGVRNGRLAPCPDSPNCVCSQDTNSQNAVEPIQLAGSKQDLMGVLKSVLKSEPRSRIVEESEDYLRVECHSAAFRFVDDVEFLVTNGVIQVRSASRVGYSDLGVNRKRVERIRAKLMGAKER